MKENTKQTLKVENHFKGLRKNENRFQERILVLC